jgi:acyl-coenzyme A thioesterase PaaI-like protein
MNTSSQEQNSETASPTSGAEVMRQFLPASPYVGHLGMRLLDMQPDTATLALPFSDAIVTIGTTVHGGAIASASGTAVAKGLVTYKLG